MKRVQVECYAGYRADERPRRLTLGEQTLEIVEVEDRWYSPGETYFRVRVKGVRKKCDPFHRTGDSDIGCWTLSLTPGSQVGVSLERRPFANSAAKASNNWRSLRDIRLAARRSLAKMRCPFLEVVQSFTVRDFCLETGICLAARFFS
jgi:hypothetical protein